MVINKAISAAKKIVELEESELDRYEEIKDMSLDIIRQIIQSGQSVDQELYKFFDDFDIRRKDIEYREYQIGKIKSILSDG